MNPAAALDARPILALRNVSKTYRRGPEEVHALVGASIDIRPGELVGIVGPSGSGKTTLLNIVAGWETSDVGFVEWHQSPTDMRRLAWRSIAIVPQDLALLEELSVGENVSLPGRLDAAASPIVPVDLLASLGLDELLDRMPAEISLGEQQRVAIARALVVRPELLVADEPTAHQDEASTKHVLSALRAGVGAGMAALIATHSLDVIETLDRVVHIRDGRIVSRLPQRG